MKLEITQKELNSALKLTKKSIGKGNAVVNITEYIKIEANKDTNEITLTSTDLKTRTEATVNATKIEEDGSLLVKNKTFSQYINSFSKSDILKLKAENNNLEIECNGSDFTFNTLSPEEFPEEREFEDESELTTLETSLDKINNAITTTSFACSTKDDLRPALTGVYFHQENEQLNLVATDTYRLALNKTGIDCYDEMEAIIPNKPLKILSKLDVDDVKITLQDEELIKFVTDKTTISSRLIAGNYVGYNTVIPNDHRTSFQINLKDLKTSLKRANIVAKAADGIITMSADEDKITFTAQNDSGDVKEDVEIEDFDGPEQKISFDASYLIDVVKKLDSEKLLFELQKETQPIVVKAIEEIEDDETEETKEEIKDYIYLIMPIRPDSE